jgi:TPR repeat protein
MGDPDDLLPVPEFVAVSPKADDVNKSFERMSEKQHSHHNNSSPSTAACLPEINATDEILTREKKHVAFVHATIDAEGRAATDLVPAETRPGRSRSGVRGGVPLIIAILTIAATSALIIQLLATRNENQAEAVHIEQRDGSVPSEPHLILRQDHSYAAADTIPLGIQVSDEAVGLAVEISGLPKGMTISSGRTMGGGRWRILAADIGDAMIHPPPGFAGVLDFAVELRLVDDTVVDRGSFRLEWNPTFATVPIESASNRATSDADNPMARSVPIQQDASERMARPRADREQIELLVERSQELVTEGDVGAARTLLQHAAEAGDARAALALGGTYDPIMLVILQAHGVAPDVSLARDWYSKARDLGSQEAQERLKLLSAARLNSEAPPAVVRVQVSRHFDPGNTAKNKGTAAVLPNPKSSTVQQAVHEQPSRSDSNGVYVDGQRVGADPDRNIRAQLLRDDAGRQLQMDSAGRQLLTNSAKPSGAGH